MGRILCLDVGQRRTGVAVSDETRTIAQGQPTIRHAGQDGLLEAVKGLVAEHGVDLVLIGLPVHLDGTSSATSRSVEKLARRISAATGLPTELVDESLSSVRANEVMALGRRRPLPRDRRPSAGPSRRRKEAVDRIAATLILQDYLSEHCRP